LLACPTTNPEAVGSNIREANVIFTFVAFKFKFSIDDNNEFIDE
jgi:hypothetical protein